MMVVIQLLGAEHRREGFDCGDAALNDFLLRQAGQQQRRDFGKTYVALAGDGVRVNKKSMPDKTPGTGFFIATHHPVSQSQAWSLRVLFVVPRPPSESGSGGSHCVARSRLTCRASHPPKWLPMLIVKPGCVL